MINGIIKNFNLNEITKKFTNNNYKKITFKIDYDFYVAIKKQKIFSMTDVLNYYIDIYINNNNLNKNKEKYINTCNSLPKRKQYTHIDYKHFSYDTKELEIINNTILTKEQNKQLEIIKDKLKNSSYKYIISDVFKFYLNNYTPKEIADIYNKDARLFQKLLKKCGLNRNRYEAQAIAKTKRNYKEIHLKVRETLIKNQTNIKGSKPENYLRQLLNVKLPIAFPNCEIIVGLNNKSILDDGKEVDIPVLIIHNSQILKIAIEYNGSYWHEDIDRDYEKERILKDKGYILYTFNQQDNRTKHQIKADIDDFINNLIINIKCNLI